MPLPAWRRILCPDWGLDRAPGSAFVRLPGLDRDEHRLAVADHAQCHRVAGPVDRRMDLLRRLAGVLHRMVPTPTITSPGCRPAWSAGEPGCTPRTSTPCVPVRHVELVAHVRRQRRQRQAKLRLMRARCRARCSPFARSATAPTFSAIVLALAVVQTMSDAPRHPA